MRFIFVYAISSDCIPGVSQYPKRNRSTGDTLIVSGLMDRNLHQELLFGYTICKLKLDLGDNF